MKYGWLNPKLCVKRKGGGKGIFAMESIDAQEKLSIFGGRVLTREEEVGDFGIQIDEEYCIGGLSKYDSDQEDAHFFNHGCDPNAGLKGQIFLVAMRDIEAGEEVVFDYAMCLYRGNDAIYQFDCSCGSQKCRGVVTNDDWKIPELQREYNGYFSYYLSQIIHKSRA